MEKLGLTFKDARQLLQKVDSIPEKAVWKTTSLTFPDRLEETHLVRYRDILQAIRALLGNPVHAKHIVYRPRRVFADTSRTRRIYTEMWTGLWWNAVQVRTLIRPTRNGHLTYNFIPAIVTSRGDPCPGHYLYRQDAAHSVLRQQISVSRLSYSWQHPSRHSSQAL